MKAQVQLYQSYQLSSAAARVLGKAIPVAKYVPVEHSRYQVRQVPCWCTLCSSVCVAQEAASLAGHDLITVLRTVLANYFDCMITWYITWATTQHSMWLPTTTATLQQLSSNCDRDSEQQR